MKQPTPQDLEVTDLGAFAPDPRPSGHSSLHSYDPRPAFPTEAPRLGWFSRLRYDIQNYEVQKGVQTAYLQAQKKSYEAALQGTVVAPSLDTWGAYDTPGGVREPTGATFSFLRSFAHRCEPVAAIHNKRIEQMAAFCRPAESRWGKQMSPGFRVRMTHREKRATAADKQEIEMLTQFFTEGGFCAPPPEERPEGWQPGLEPFVRALMRDQLTLDWIAVRTWASAKDPKKYPVVAFACVDAALIRNKRRVVVDVVDGVNEYAEQENERTNLRPRTEVTHVLMDSDVGGREMQEFTDKELFTAFMRPRTDQNANGYGYSVLEQLINSMTIWCAARDLNALRFDRDAAPRGILTILGNMNPQQFNKFVQDWKNMMLGIRNRHTMPILQGSPITGSSVNYTPIDPTPRDMEYSQFTFAVGLWCHCLYGIHPDETGFSASSPFRPPLSEASPEDNLKYSQDTGLSPLLRWLENLLNRHILWRMYPGREYTFEFCGMGDFNTMDDINTLTAALTAGLISPEMAWNYWDVDPGVWAKHPAAKSFFGPFPQAVQFMMSMQQGQAQEAQGDQEQQQGAEQAQGDQEAQGQQQEADQAQQKADADQQDHDNEADAHGQKLDERKMALAEKQHALAADQQAHTQNMDKFGLAQDAQNSVDNPKKKGYNTSGSQRRSAPGFIKKGADIAGPDAPAPDLAGMQEAIDGAAATSALVKGLATERRARRFGTIIVRK